MLLISKPTARPKPMPGFDRRTAQSFPLIAHQGSLKVMSSWTHHRALTALPKARFYDWHFVISLLFAVAPESNRLDVDFQARQPLPTSCCATGRPPGTSSVALNVVHHSTVYRVRCTKRRTHSRCRRSIITFGRAGWLERSIQAVPRSRERYYPPLNPAPECFPV